MSDLLSIGASVVRAYQTALTTVSENIAGAGVAGFAPQEPGDRDSGAGGGGVVHDPSPRRRRPTRTMIED